MKPNLDDKRFAYVGVPMTALTIEAIGGKGRDKGKNMFLLGLIARMFDLDVAKLESMVKEWGGERNEDVLQRPSTPSTSATVTKSDVSRRPSNSSLPKSTRPAARRSS